MGLSAITAGPTRDWMTQARCYLYAVYQYPPAQNGVVPISLSYLKSNVPTVQQQLAYAAVRLAYALNTAFPG
jgi:hypothetical protein